MSEQRLPTETLHALADAAISLDLERDALLVGIDRQFVASLRTA